MYAHQTPALRILERAIGSAREFTGACERTTVTISDDKEALTIDRHIEWPVAAFELSLLEERVFAAAHGSHARLTGRRERSKFIFRTFEPDDVAVGEVVRDRVEVLLLCRHPGRCGEERAIHYLILATSLLFF